MINLVYKSMFPPSKTSFNLTTRTSRVAS